METFVYLNKWRIMADRLFILADTLDELEANLLKSWHEQKSVGLHSNQPKSSLPHSKLFSLDGRKLARDGDQLLTSYHLYLRQTPHNGQADEKLGWLLLTAYWMYP